jgi:hypothetical protein
VVIKTQEDKRLISDLAETFHNMRKLSIKLNLEKCTFGVPSGKLLGYMVSHRRIDPNPEKVLAITNMKPLENPAWKCLIILPLLVYACVLEEFIPEPTFEEFKTMYTRILVFIFVSNDSSALEHIAPITSSCLTLHMHAMLNMNPILSDTS